MGQALAGTVQEMGDFMPHLVTGDARRHLSCLCRAVQGMEALVSGLFQGRLFKDPPPISLNAAG